MMKLSSIVSIILLSVNLNAGEIQSDVDLLKTAMSKMILKVNTLEKQNIEVLKMLAKENTKKEEIETYKLMKNKEIVDIQQKISILEKKLSESETSKIETQKSIKEQEEKLALLKQKNEQERISLENTAKAEQERINLENKKIEQLNAKLAQEKVEAENKLNLVKQEKERIDAENKRIAEEKIAIENKKAETEKQEKDIFEKAKVMQEKMNQEKIKEEERLAKQERERIEAENKRIAEEERKAEQKRLAKKDNYSIDGLFNGTIKETPEEPKENVVVERTISNSKKENINNAPVNNQIVKEGNVRYVSATTLSVREKPTVNSSKVSELKRGDKIYISGQVGGWCKTDLGFVDCKHLDK